MEQARMAHNSNGCLLLGIDGGGSKTDALLVNEQGQVVGAGRGGSANYHHLGLEPVQQSLQEALEMALQGRQPDQVAFCMTAADFAHDFAQLHTVIAGLGLAEVSSLYNDVMGIFRAGSRFPYGVGVVCGTGFNAGGLSKDGREIRFPALGDITGDCAGGGYLSVQALGAAFRAWDGRGKPTQLVEAILAAWDVPSIESIAEKYVQGEIPYEKILSLSPLVFEIAEMGDAVAQSLISHQGVELGTAASAILRRLDLQDEVCDVVIGGGLCRGKGDLLMNTIRETVCAVAPNAEVKRLDVAPVVGAVLLAADCAGIPTDEAFIHHLKTTLPNGLSIGE
jgi:N-acetylglucosamine kinase-like BadF-type ATPase